METSTQILSWLKELTGRLAPRHDAFRYLRSVRTENRGKRSAQFTGTGWQGLVPRTEALRRRFAALLKTLD
jgi:hypothetical protein